MNWRVSLGFSAICLLLGSEWLLAQVWTNPLSTPLQLALAHGVLALLLGVWTLRGRRQALPRSVLTQVLLWGTVLFASPTVVIGPAAGHVESLTTVLLFTLIPAVVVFLSGRGPASFGMQESPFRQLFPALAGVGGAALLLPFVTPSNALGWIWLTAEVLTTILVATAALKLHTLLTTAPLLRASTAIAGVSSLVCLFAATLTQNGWTMQIARSDWLPLLGSALLLSAPNLLLTLWLLREMPPVAFSSRFVLVPLITIVEGYLILRPQVSWTTPAGLALMAASAGYLLWSR